MFFFSLIATFSSLRNLFTLCINVRTPYSSPRRISLSRRRICWLLGIVIFDQKLKKKLNLSQSIKKKLPGSFRRLPRQPDAGEPPPVQLRGEQHPLPVRRLHRLLQQGRPLQGETQEKVHQDRIS